MEVWGVGEDMLVVLSGRCCEIVLCVWREDVAKTQNVGITGGNSQQTNPFPPQIFVFVFFF